MKKSLKYGKRFGVIALAALLLAGCTSQPASSVSTSAATSAVTSTTGEAEGAVSLKDDFYAAVNAEWLETTVIPADSTVVSSASDLMYSIQDILMADFDAMLNGEKETGSPEMDTFVEYYRLATDFDARNADGAAPLLPYIEKVESLTSLADLNSQLGEWIQTGMPLPFVPYVYADMANASVNALYVYSQSTFLLDKSYYEDEATKVALQEIYAVMASTLLQLAGKTETEAAEITQQALAFDESLAAYVASTEEASDYTATYNPVSLAELDEGLAGLDLTTAFTQLLGETPETVIVTNPAYMAAMDTLITEENFANLQSWMLLSTVNMLAPYLSEDFVVAADLYVSTLLGVVESTSATDSAYFTAVSGFGDVVGRYYGETYFGEEARADVTAMVNNIIDTYETRLTANTWLSEQTRATAIEKLRGIAIKIGYPDTVPAAYTNFSIVTAEEGGSFASNIMALSTLSLADNFAKWNQEVNRDEWIIAGSTVNAMYSPTQNSINFPAAILQAPFYSLDQSVEANYGGIGAVIAHEISHAFDPNGAKFDVNGSLSEWWTEEDYATFEALSQAMIAEFDGIEYAGGTVNGTLTVAENIADAGGLACAIDAARAVGATDLTELFTNWAVIWRQVATPEYDAYLLASDVHAPSELRANIQLQNMDDFFTTFGIEEGDGMYRAPEDRVIIW